MAYKVKCKVIGPGKGYVWNGQSGAPQRHSGGTGSYMRRYASGAGGAAGRRRSAPRGRGTY